jgi:hypothetical protein
MILYDNDYKDRNKKSEKYIENFIDKFSDQYNDIEKYIVIDSKIVNRKRKKRNSNIEKIKQMKIDSYFFKKSNQ